MIIICIRIFVLVFPLAAPAFGQNTQPRTPMSPCPSVFMYEPPAPDTEPGTWYGVINLTTDIALSSLLLNIVVDNKADLLGNWIGDVSTKNNMDFNIESSDYKLSPDSEKSVRFFVKFNPLGRTPKLKVIRLNGREICNIDRPLPNIDTLDDTRAFKLETTTKSRGWDDIWPDDQPKTMVARPRLTNSEVTMIDYAKKPFINSPGVSNNEVMWMIANPQEKSNLQRTTSRPAQATPIPRRIDPARPAYDDYDASDDETRNANYFDGPPLVRPGV